MQHRQPYGEWLDSNLVDVEEIYISRIKRFRNIPKKNVSRLQKAFGYTYEEVKTSILTMAKNGSEAIGSHGYGYTTCRAF